MEIFVRRGEVQLHRVAAAWRTASEYTGKFVLFCLGIAVLMFFVFRDTQNKKQAKKETQTALPKIAQKTTDPTATETYSESRDFSPALLRWGSRGRAGSTMRLRFSAGGNGFGCFGSSREKLTRKIPLPRSSARSTGS
ncbi:MAG: hypothetical protein M3463_13635 [Verrucomicrobiota bacterium]|nr:hypothetical protein [Verrucomicrobiota bacterium]